MNQMQQQHGCFLSKLLISPSALLQTRYAKRRYEELLSIMGIRASLTFQTFEMEIT
jgi:hypothetical protein